MAQGRFQHHLRFALHKEPHLTREEIPLNQLEQIGNVLSWIVYEIRAVLTKLFYDPRFITVCFTLMGMIFAALLFYPTTTWNIISRICNTFFAYINWNYVRFALWVLSETTILGIGMRAFGRFSNPKLMEHYQIQT